MVRRKYSEIAFQDKETNQSSCCGSGCCSSEIHNIMHEEYAGLNGYHPDADLGLGCGLPTRFAAIQKGDTVIDLGSGAGNDCFIARAETGAEGKVIGIDLTPAMIEKARANAEKSGFGNVEFRQGDIEHLPVPDNTANVIISNCVLNLVPNKVAVFREIFRVLKPGGHFSISDVVLTGDLPQNIRQTAEMYTGCIAGAIRKDAYLASIRSSGFINIMLQKEKAIHIPDDILANYVNEAGSAAFTAGTTGIFSITVYAEKPKACCGPDCCR